MSKLKELIKRKFTLFEEIAKNLGVEIKKSKANNWYIEIGGHKVKRKIQVFTPYSVTKKSIDKLYSKEIELTSGGNVLLLSEKGKLMFKCGTTWNTVSRGRKGIRIINDWFEPKVSKDLLNLAFLDKPYSWITEYPKLLRYNLAYEFSNVEEFFDYLGINETLLSTYIQDIDYKVNLLETMPDSVLTIRKLDKNSRSNFLKYIQIAVSSFERVKDYFKLTELASRSQNLYVNYKEAVKNLSKYMITNGVLEIPEDPQEFRRLLMLILNLEGNFKPIRDEKMDGYEVHFSAGPIRIRNPFTQSTITPF